MPIITYIEKICRSSQAGNSTSQGGYEWIEVCYEVEKPIPDWNISPATILKEWHPSQPIPSTENLTVHYPELGLLTVYKKYKGFRYYAHIAANEYVELIAPTGEDLENLIGLQHNLQLRYNNFSKLPEKGDVKVKVTLGVIATEEKSGKVNEIDLPTERKEVVITLRRTQESGSTPSPKPAEREVLRMTLNHATRELTGDKEITFIPIINSPFSFIRDRTRRLFLSAFPGSSHTFGEKKSEVFDIGLFKIQTYTSSSLDRIVFQLSDTYLRTGRVDEGGIDFTKPQILRWQNNSVFYSSRFSRKYFDIELTVINDTTAFHIDKKEFKYLLKTDKKERAEGVFTIKNPNLLTFTINNADFLEVTEVKGNGEEEVVLKFRSLSSEMMTVGEYKGWLKVTS